VKTRELKNLGESKGHRVESRLSSGDLDETLFFKRRKQGEVGEVGTGGAKDRLEDKKKENGKMTGVSSQTIRGSRRVWTIELGILMRRARKGGTTQDRNN